MDSRRFELNAPAVIAETIDGEVMVMNLTQGIYYSVTGAGAVAWPALVAGVEPAVTATAIANASGTDVAVVSRDYGTFIERLYAEGILRVLADGATGHASTDVPHGGAAYADFGFERFDDMRAMLVIDPVHEVGDFGWPQPAPGKEKG